MLFIYLIMFFGFGLLVTAISLLGVYEARLEINKHHQVQDAGDVDGNLFHLPDVEKVANQDH